MAKKPIGTNWEARTYDTIRELAARWHRVGLSGTDFANGRGEAYAQSISLLLNQPLEDVKRALETNAL